MYVPCGQTAQRAPQARRESCVHQHKVGGCGQAQSNPRYPGTYTSLSPSPHRLLVLFLCVLCSAMCVPVAAARFLFILVSRSLGDAALSPSRAKAHKKMGHTSICCFRNSLPPTRCSRNSVPMLWCGLWLPPRPGSCSPFLHAHSGNSLGFRSSLGRLSLGRFLAVWTLEGGDFMLGGRCGCADVQRLCRAATKLCSQCTMVASYYSYLAYDIAFAHWRSPRLRNKVPLCGPRAPAQATCAKGSSTSEKTRT